jgi:hypothetical protein
MFSVTTFYIMQGQYLWVSRFGRDEITLEAISMSRLLLEEAHALQIYAIHSLSELLARPVLYDPFSVNASNDSIQRNTSLAQRVRNAFRSKSTSSSASTPNRHSSNSSDQSTVFGRPLDDVRTAFVSSMSAFSCLFAAAY